MAATLVRAPCRQLSSRLHCVSKHSQQSRHFFPNPLDAANSSPQTVTVSRTLPYPSIAIYDIIADISSYPKFVPFCSQADVTSWSSKDKYYQRSWPQEASVTVGFKDGIAESFVSSVFCVPPSPEKGRGGVGIVEAVSGQSQHELSNEDIAHHTHNASKEDQRNGPLELLKTRWTVRPYPYRSEKTEQASSEVKDQPAVTSKEVCDVDLHIEYKFSNPLYDLMSRAATPKIADKMIEAFEKRVHSLLQK